jgi:hypothetical protein
MQEYELIYKKPLMQEFSELNFFEVNTIRELMKEQMQRAS